jgi:hypothetical protein
MVECARMCAKLECVRNPKNFEDGRHDLGKRRDAIGGEKCFRSVHKTLTCTCPGLQ